jgi:hypothetical protein
MVQIFLKCWRMNSVQNVKLQFTEQLLPKRQLPEHLRAKRVAQLAAAYATLEPIEQSPFDFAEFEIDKFLKENK